MTSSPLSVRRRLVAGLVALLGGATLVLGDPSPAAAVVTPLHGFRATVDGFTSWYGSYSMGSLGPAWCIDHGSRAPDPAYAYAPTGLAGVPADTRTAMAWVLGAHGSGFDRVGHAAVMLVLHDLMDARYPSGPLDVDRLGVGQLAGFDGLEARVLQRARVLKADGLAHRHLRGPLALTVVASPTRAVPTAVVVRLHDAGGRPLPGVPVRLEGARAGGRVAMGTTAADGTWRTTVDAPPRPVTLRAVAEVPRLVLDAWAPTATAAQRIARPGRESLQALLGLPGPPPPTSSTTTSTTTTTTTTVPTTTTTLPASTTTVPTTTSTVAAVAMPSTTTTTVPTPTSSIPAPAPPPASLPRTGRDVTALVLLALGLVLLGSAALETAARRV